MFGSHKRVDMALNRDVERLLKSADHGVLPIVEAGEPVLRAQCVQYDGQLSKHTLHKLIETMRTTMLAAPGVGLAGPQIGLNLALAVVEDHADGDDDPREIAEFLFHVIINPAYEPVGRRRARSTRAASAWKATRRCASAGSTLWLTGTTRTATGTRSACMAGRRASSSTRPTI